MDCEGRLHLALTHGMKPYEPFEIPLQEMRPGLTRRDIKWALKEATKRQSGNERAIVHAYRKTGATEKRYPNSLELLKAIIGSEKLYGGITEICPAKHKWLTHACRNSKVKACCASWRTELQTGILSCPYNLQMPWLFSMDPMTYSDDDGDECSNRLHRNDFSRLSDALKAYVASRQPGVAILFVYNVRKSVQEQFQKFIERLAHCAGMSTCCCWLTHRGGNRNLAGLLRFGVELGSCADLLEAKTGTA